MVPCTEQSILRYNCDIGHISPTNHVCFDEGMNNLPLTLIPPNQRDLKRLTQGDKFPAVPIVADTQNKSQAYVYLFFQNGREQFESTSYVCIL